MKRVLSGLMVLLICVSLAPLAYASDELTVEDVESIILEYHGIKTDRDVYDYLSLYSNNISRESVLTAVIRSFGVYPVEYNTHDWEDEDSQSEEYRPYIDYAYQNGIILGIGDNKFAPDRPITEKELRVMLERAKDIEPYYSVKYNSLVSKLLSADIQKGISEVPEVVLNSYLNKGKKIIATEYPIVNGYPTKDCIGYIIYASNIWISIDYPDGTIDDSQDRTVIHEFGHYLGYWTSNMNRYSVPDEVLWQYYGYMPGSDIDSSEYMAESFVSYVLDNDEMKLHAPITYSHIEDCLVRIK